MSDEIVDEIRKIREAYAEQFNYDLGAIFRDIQERERNSGREYVTLPPRRIVPMTEVPLRAEPESDTGAALPVATTQES